MYSGPFCGPVEGILVTVLIYVASGIFGACPAHWISLRTRGSVGPSFWDQRFLAFAHLDHVVYTMCH